MLQANSAYRSLFWRLIESLELLSVIEQRPNRRDRGDSGVGAESSTWGSISLSIEKLTVEIFRLCFKDCIRFKGSQVIFNSIQALQRNPRNPNLDIRKREAFNGKAINSSCGCCGTSPHIPSFNTLTPRSSSKPLSLSDFIDDFTLCQYDATFENPNPQCCLYQSQPISNALHWNNNKLIVEKRLLTHQIATFPASIWKSGDIPAAPLHQHHPIFGAECLSL